MNNPYLYNCNECLNKCDNISKGTYIFKDDVKYSEIFENEIIDIINKSGYSKAKKTSQEGYPDIEISNKEGLITCYIEVKAQQRTFMKVSRLLPNSNLEPSETIALNLSDLRRYFILDYSANIPIYLIWVVSNRPCVLKNRMSLLFYQEIKELKKIYKTYGISRKFIRKSGHGDIVNGVHKGVVVNYHFSLNELRSDISQLFNIL